MATIAIGAGLVLLLGAISIVGWCLIRAIAAFVKKDNRKGTIYSLLTILAILFTKWMFFPSNPDPNSPEYIKLSNERNAYIEDLEQDAAKSLGELTQRGDSKVDIQVVSPGDKHFNIRIVMISEIGDTDEESREIILEDMRKILKKIQKNKKYENIKDINLTIDQYSKEQGNGVYHAFVQGHLTYKKLQKKNIEELNFENYQSYFKKIMAANGPMRSQ